MAGEDRARGMLAHSDRARRSTLRFMKVSSDSVTEVVLPQLLAGNFHPLPQLRRQDGSSAVTKSRSSVPHGHADFGLREPGGYRAWATVNRGRGSRRGELLSLVGLASDEESTEEILERKWMAPFGPDCRFGRRMINNANCGVDRRRSQNEDGIEGRGNDVNTYRRSQIYRRIRLIERGFGQVWTGHGGDTDGCCQQGEN